MNPIFIIGTERSGTNLLRLILNAHSAIAVPHPPHIMKFLSPLVPRYGDLHTDENFRRLIADACRLVELHTYPWEIRPDREQVFQQARERTLLAIYGALYDQYLASTGKQRWACKSTFMIEHVEEILSYYPQARFIFMVRDVRDVAVSAKTSIFNHFHVYYSALRWQREQRLGLDWMIRLGPEQIMLLKYEELLADPSGVTKKLCAFLDLPFEAGMLEYHRSIEAQKSGSLSISWENTAKPVLRDNIARFRSCLTGQEIFLIEAIACAELLELGYLPLNPPELLQQKRNEISRERMTYRIIEARLKLKAELKHLFHDRNSIARLRKDLYLFMLRARLRMNVPHA
jgi:hypothetical protein